MPTWGEVSQIITALAAVGALIVSWMNRRQIEVVRHATNSLKDELVTEVRRAEYAQGMKDEKDRSASDT